MKRRTKKTPVDNHGRGGRRVRTAKTAAAKAELGPRAAQQDRGQRRVESILDAAEQVIVEVGYDAATTDAIAKRAGASMGSFYHFFPNKEAVLAALAHRYAGRMSAINAHAMPVDVVWLPLDVLFDRIVDGQVQFCSSTPAFLTVHDATTRHLAGGHHGPNEELDRALMEQVQRFLAARLPRMPEREMERAARASITAVHAIIDQSMRLHPSERDGLLRELKRMMVRYFAPLDEQYGVRRS